jgi:hypothetical protein
MSPLQLISSPERQSWRSLPGQKEAHLPTWALFKACLLPPRLGAPFPSWPPWLADDPRPALRGGPAPPGPWAPVLWRTPDALLGTGHRLIGALGKRLTRAEQMVDSGHTGGQQNRFFSSEVSLRGYRETRQPGRFDQLGYGARVRAGPGRGARGGRAQAKLLTAAVLGLCSRQRQHASTASASSASPSCLAAR